MSQCRAKKRVRGVYSPVAASASAGTNGDEVVIKGRNACVVAVVYVRRKRMQNLVLASALDACAETTVTLDVVSSAMRASRIL